MIITTGSVVWWQVGRHGAGDIAEGTTRPSTETDSWSALETSRLASSDSLLLQGHTSNKGTLPKPSNPQTVPFPDDQAFKFMSLVCVCVWAFSFKPLHTCNHTMISKCVSKSKDSHVSL